MTCHNMSNQFFSNEAFERAINIFPKDGAEMYDRVIGFISVASAHKNTPLVVPPDIDPFLHELLSARNKNGEVLEKIRICHIFSAELGDSKGKTMLELESPIARNTCRILRESSLNFLLDKQFEQGACTLTVLCK